MARKTKRIFLPAPSAKMLHADKSVRATRANFGTSRSEDDRLRKDPVEVPAIRDLNLADEPFEERCPRI